MTTAETITGPARGVPSAADPLPTRASTATIDFRDIYVAHFDYVWCNLRRLGVQDSSVADAVQDVFVVVHRRLPEFVAHGSAKAWLFGITLRVARDYRRRNQRKGGLAPLLEETVAGEHPSPMDSAVRSESVQILERLLEHLDEEKREVFVLVEVNELTVPQAAEALGASIPAVQSRLRTARMQFDAAVARYHRSQR
jgi:RNA polymerase sigma-70 factor (ECF subfamily)